VPPDGARVNPAIPRVGSKILDGRCFDNLTKTLHHQTPRRSMLLTLAGASVALLMGCSGSETSGGSTESGAPQQCGSNSQCSVDQICCSADSLCGKPAGSSCSGNEHCCPDIGNFGYGMCQGGRCCLSSGGMCSQDDPSMCCSGECISRDRGCR